MMDLFGEPDDSRVKPAKQLVVPPKPGRPKKKSEAPEPVANRFNIKRPAPEPEPEPVIPEPVQVSEPEIPGKKQDNTAVISPAEPLNNEAGEIQRAIDTFKLFGMLGD